MTCRNWLSHITLGCIICGLPIYAFAENMPSNEEMWAIIQQQQQQIQELQERLNMTESKVAQTEQKIEVTDGKVEAAGTAIDELYAEGLSGSEAGWWNRTQLGGYGEMHLNLGADDEIDFHRWVVFINHDFNDRIRLHSELELEHSVAGEGKNGEVELEQAYIEMDINDYLRAKAGLFLMPVGILNETHEPATFYGVERNPIENKIIPSTWWEGGLGLSATTDYGLSGDIALHSGLRTNSDFNIRSGRKKVSEADTDWATTARVKYTGIPGVELALTGQYQSDLAEASINEKIEATFITAHADIRRGGFGFRALYGRWDLHGSAPEAVGADEQFGFYLEPSYRLDTGNYGTVGIFGRYNFFDLNAGDANGSEEKLYEFGMNYWPHPNVVFKWDIGITDKPGSESNEEIINFGVGYHF